VTGREAAARPSSAARVAIASAIGTTIEWYDFFIYGTAAAVVFAPQFFPRASEVAGTLAAFATFAIGFVARPLGGVVMGHFGDRRGRKSMLVWSLLLMGAATFGIGVLPNYARIGAWAPMLLTALRFVQGFALGGEWGGAVLMSVEHAPSQRRGFFGSLVALGLPIGIILSNLVFLVASVAVAPDEFAAWGWRVPFLASGALVIVGLFVRVGLTETPAFAAVQQAGAARRMPVIDVLENHSRTVLLAAGSYLGISAIGYLVIVYYVTYATRQLGFSLPMTLGLLLVAAVVFAISILVCATQSDRIGRRRVMVWGNAALVAWSLVFFPLLDMRSVPTTALALCVMLAVQGAYIGTQPAVFAELFPVEVRFSGASLALTVGTIVGGAPAPFIATALVDAAHGSSLVTLYAAATALVSWRCAVWLEKMATDSLLASSAGR
jgi:metabolite-proton symporter